MRISATFIPQFANPKKRQHLDLRYSPYHGLLTKTANERTFLAYQRTALAFSMTGVTISWLYQVQHAPSPDPAFGYHVTGKPLASVCQGGAVLWALCGGMRFYRQQRAMAAGKALAGGFEIVVVAVLALLVGLSRFRSPRATHI